MTTPISSSQASCVTGGLNQAFVKFIPKNALARLAFSDTYEKLNANHQSNDARDNRLMRMSLTNSEQEYDASVFRLKYEIDHSTNESDESETEPPTPRTPSDEDGRAGGMIWVGCYEVGFDPRPLELEMGWTIGKGLRRESAPLSSLPSSMGESLSDCGSDVDILLCTRSFLKKYNVQIRGVGARLQFAQTNLALTLIIEKYRSQVSQVTVNDTLAEQRVFALNQHQMKIRFDKLEYQLEYTDYAQTKLYNRARIRYVKNIGNPMVPLELPSPPRETRTIGQWTLLRAIGRAGGTGKVFVASNTKNEMAAIKMSTVTDGLKTILDDEIATSKAITKLAEKWDEGVRIVRQIEVIRIPSDFSYRNHPDEIAGVLQPLTPQTFYNLIFHNTVGLHKGMSVEAACAFREALLGLKVMHDHGWQHGDLKPANIGFCDFPLKGVILDVGQAKFLKPRPVLLPTPGSRGTIEYLAPETELYGSSFSADIWAMGIIGYQLTYRNHPWSFAKNPWRKGEEFEGLRTEWGNKYKRYRKMLLEDHQLACSSGKQGKRFIHLGALLHDMLNFEPGLDNTHAPFLRREFHRINIDEVLGHPNWGPLLPKPENQPVKKAKLQSDDRPGAEDSCRRGKVK
ncbi:kinase-like protein [Drechslerella dactyloides]|uniref:Kinase-like protein n=1 Tax=Drechslerella dactyloides TaxID=74499 RepID=A0AAD6NFW1_DREDA|nr:kinase-like protein [Drechslerella dactyloides]